MSGVDRKAELERKKARLDQMRLEKKRKEEERRKKSDVGFFKCLVQCILFIT